MESSPLTQQARPLSFQPKIASLYENLFKVIFDSRQWVNDTEGVQSEDDAVHSEGFWSEFFLLKPDISSLRRLFEEFSPEDLLHFQVH